MAGDDEQTPPQVITASRTADGSPVYRRADGSWSGVLADACVLTDEHRIEELVKAAKTLEREISDPYAFPVRVGAQGPEPLSVREAIRGRGPTSPLRRAAPNPS